MKRRNAVIYALVLVGAIALTIGVASLFLNIDQRRDEAAEYPLRVVEVAEDELDPAVWGQNYPRQYDRFMMTQIDGNRTPYGGSEVLQQAGTISGHGAPLGRLRLQQGPQRGARPLLRPD